MVFNTRKFLNKNKQGMPFWTKFLGSGKTDNFDFFSANLPKSGVESGFGTNSQLLQDTICTNSQA